MICRLITIKAKMHVCNERNVEIGKIQTIYYSTSIPNAIKMMAATPGLNWLSSMAHGWNKDQELNPKSRITRAKSH